MVWGVQGLRRDIAFIEGKYVIAVPVPSPQATEYASFLEKLAAPAFVCHFYNYYFAHTAGGRMIGQRVMDSVFGGHLFEFYKWDGDVKEILTAVKAQVLLPNPKSQAPSPRPQTQNSPFSKHS